MEPQCANCGVRVYEDPGEAVHPVQAEYRTEDWETYCEACFFPDSYEEDGHAMVAEKLARRMSAAETADALEGAYTKDRLRRYARILEIPLERGITKRGMAEKLARERRFFMVKALVGDRELG